MWVDSNHPPELTERMARLCAEGDARANEGAYREAIEHFQQAYELIPEPKHRSVTTTWILIAIGDTAFLQGNLPVATQALHEIGLCDYWHTNPFVRLRRGQVAFENGDLQKASDELASAFMLGGYQIFDGVDDKYPIFVLSKMHPPVPPIAHRLACYHLQEPAVKAGQKPWWRFW